MYLQHCVIRIICRSSEFHAVTSFSLLTLAIYQFTTVITVITTQLSYTPYTHHTHTIHTWELPDNWSMQFSVTFTRFIYIKATTYLYIAQIINLHGRNIYFVTRNDVEFARAILFSDLDTLTIWDVWPVHPPLPHPSIFPSGLAIFLHNP